MRGIYNIKTGALAVSEAEHPLENDRFFIDFTGHPRFELTDQLDELTDDFSQCHFMKWFHGPYLLYIYDKLKKELTVSQHFFGAPVPFYIADMEGGGHMFLSAIRSLPARINRKAYEAYITENMIMSQKW